MAADIPGVLDPPRLVPQPESVEADATFSLEVRLVINHDAIAAIDEGLAVFVHHPIMDRSLITFTPVRS